jgi:hypothetical protein
MRKIILTLAGAALIAGSANQVALSKERHHFRNTQQFTERFRNANAHAVPSYVPDAESASSLSGAWGSMTGFN